MKVMSLVSPSPWYLTKMLALSSLNPLSATASRFLNLVYLFTLITVLFVNSMAITKLTEIRRFLSRKRK